MGIPATTLPQQIFPNTTVEPRQLAWCRENLFRFVTRYEPTFYRIEQSGHLQTFLEGLLSDLPRKSIEPIATDHGEPRRPLQRFVGCGAWDDERVLQELHAHVGEEIEDPEGILIVDTSSFPKKGTESVGVKRPWCNPLGKEDNCQIGVYVAYGGQASTTLVDRRLYLPREGARSKVRRKKGHVPDDVRYQSTIEIAEELLLKAASRLPHAWMVGDDEFGRKTWLRQELMEHGEQYVMEVPHNTLIRDLEAPEPKRTHRRGYPRKRPWVRAADWALQQPSSRWTRVHLSDGAKGPLVVKAIKVRAQSRMAGKAALVETLLITRTLDRKPEWHYWMVHTRAEVPVETLAWVAAQRQRIEECFEFAKDDCGMDHYEVRSWVGWHHHMTLSLLALWFLVLEKRRVGKKSACGDSTDHGRGISISSAESGNQPEQAGASSHVPAAQE